MDPIAPGNHDRAWNDPPKFAYNTASGGGQGGVAGRRRLLNKRVPVPIGPAPPTQPNATSFMRPTDPPPTKGSLPPRGPLPTTTAGPPRCTSNLHTTTYNSDNTETTQTSQEMMQEVETILNTTLMALAENIKESVQEVIVQKIALMTGMWKGDSFNPVIQKRILSLAKALAGGDYDAAWALHQGLIVDYTSLCSPWMVGVKTLISEAKQSKKAKEEKDRVAIEEGEKTDKINEEKDSGVTEEGKTNEKDLESNVTVELSSEEVFQSSRTSTEPDQLPITGLKVGEDTTTEGN